MAAEAVAEAVVLQAEEEVGAVVEEERVEVLADAADEEVDVVAAKAASKAEPRSLWYPTDTRVCSSPRGKRMMLCALATLTLALPFMARRGSR